MNAAEKMKLISSEVDDLSGSLDTFLAEKKRKGKQPTQGDGAEYARGDFGATICIKPGLPQGATATAIRRKIVTIRDHLNELGKLV